MGEAQAAAARGASAIFWNPAGMGECPAGLGPPAGEAGQAPPDWCAEVSHASHLEGVHGEHAAAATRRGPWSLGAGLGYLGAGSLTETDEAGRDAGSFSPHELAVFLAAARELSWPGLRLGLAVKHARSTILDTAQTWAADLGLLSPAWADGRLRVAARAANLGGDLRYESASEPLPRELRLAGAWSAGAWTAAVDVALPEDNSPFVAVGGERLWRLAGIEAALRGGFNSRSLGDLQGISAVSFGFGIAARRLSLDYSLSPLGTLGVSHRVSIGVSF